MSKSLKSYEFLKLRKVEFYDLIHYHFKDLFRSVHRRLTKKMSIRNPWHIVVSEKMHGSIFMYWFNAMKEHGSDFGRHFTIKRDRQQNIKNIIIEFNHVGTMIYHLSKALGDTGADKCFQKELGKCVGSIVVDEENPFVMEFNFTRNIISLNCKYEVVNQFGYVISH